jgi:hypothetical protein
MKKHARKDHGSARNHRSGDGRWEFNVAGGKLMPLGDKADTARVAYRTATGELGFLPR